MITRAEVQQFIYFNRGDMKAVTKSMMLSTRFRDILRSIFIRRVIALLTMCVFPFDRRSVSW